MKVFRWVATYGLAFLWAMTPSYSQLLSPSDGAAVPLSVQLAWTDATHKDGSSSAIWARVILFLDHITVSKFGLTPESSDMERGCDKTALDVGPDGKVLPSDTNIQRFMKCRDRSTPLNVTATRHAVMLPFVPGPSKCTETGLANGSYRICAALLQQSPNTLRMEYEEDSNHDGRLSASRARFDVTLLRGVGALSNRILNCTAKTLAAFTFNPREPSKLAPFDHATVERRTVR
jgi:hypothetical protein